MSDERTVGYRVLIFFGVLLSIMLILGQTMSFINYDFTVSLGLQEPKQEITEMGVAVNKGFGVSDTLIYLPLLVFGLVGLWKRKFWGLFAMSGALAITVYWPIVIIFMLLFAAGTPGFNFTRFYSYTIMLVIITIYGIWGLWYLHKNRKILTSE